MKAALLFVAVGVSLLRSGAPVELLSRPAVGDVFEEQERCWSNASGAHQDDESNRPSFSVNTDGDVSALPGSTSDSHSTILDEVLSVKDGKRVKVKRTFVVSTSTIADTSGGDSAPRSKRAAFEGQTVVLVADGDGTRIVGELDGEEELEPSDLSLASRWEQVLPGTPVEIGATWSLPEEASRGLLKGMSIAKARAWCTLDGVDERAAGKPARIKLEIRATTSAGSEGPSEVEASGTVLWSTESGHLVEVSLSGKITSTHADGGEETRTFGVLHEVRKVE